MNNNKAKIIMSFQLIRVIGIVVGGTIGSYVSGKIIDYIKNKNEPLSSNTNTNTNTETKNKIQNNDKNINSFEDYFKKEIEFIMKNPSTLDEYHEHEQVNKKNSIEPYNSINNSANNLDNNLDNNLENNLDNNIDTDEFTDFYSNINHKKFESNEAEYDNNNDYKEQLFINDAIYDNNFYDYIILIARD